MGSGDAYLRTGRGGAGNFYSSRDVEEDIAKKDKIEVRFTSSSHVHPTHTYSYETAPISRLRYK